MENLYLQKKLTAELHQHSLASSSVLCVDIHRQALNTRLSRPHGPDARKSLSHASLALKFVVMLHLRLHSFFGIMGNSVLVTLGFACHCRGAVAVAPI